MWRKGSRDILEKFGIGINHHANGVFLPTVKGVSDAAYHPSLHTKDYYEKVEMLLGKAERPEDVFSILEFIGKELLNGTF